MKNESSKTELSVKLIEKHFNNVGNNNTFLSKVNSGIKDFSANSLKRSNLSNQSFSGFDFSQASFSGSVFHDTLFEDCEFEGAIAEYCDFYNCSFRGKKAKKSLSYFNFNNSNFINCNFEGLKILTSSSTNSLFKNTQFSNCIIDLSSFENTVFDNVSFKNISFEELNIEFAEFKKIKCSNVVLPFAQVSYVFGALDYILNTQDDIKISSKSLHKNGLTVIEFRQLLPNLILYYQNMQEFFPLANIYVSLGENEKALTAIRKGIKVAGRNKDFRMLKFYCKLAVKNYWLSKKERFEMYETISNLDQWTNMTSAELHNFYLHLGEFRQILLFSDNNMPMLYYNIKSNIDDNQFKKLSIVIKAIENIINNVKNETVTFSIELRHESPFSILITVAATANIIFLICGCIDKLCSTVKSIQEIQINQQTIEINKKEIEKLNRLSEKEKSELDKSKIILSGSSYYKNID